MVGLNRSVSRASAVTLELMARNRSTASRLVVAFLISSSLLGGAASAASASWQPSGASSTAGDMYTPWIVPSAGSNGRVGAPGSTALAQATLINARNDLAAIVANKSLPQRIRKLPVVLASPLGNPVAASPSSQTGSVIRWFLLAALAIAAAFAVRPAGRRTG